MKELGKLLILWLSVMISVVGIVGCNSVEKSEHDFDLEQFEIEMESKGYKYERQDLEGVY